MKKLSGLGNLLWSIGILICLVALFIGIVISAFCKYRGPTVSELQNAASAESAVTVSDVGPLKELTETNDAGQAYIDSLTFLCDSSTIGLKDYGVLTDGNATKQVWGTVSGSLPVSEFNTALIIDPSDNLQKSPADAAAANHPSKLFISIGMDMLNDTNQSTFISSYKKLVTDIKTASPDTVIVCCSLTSITSNYSGSAISSTQQITEVNEWVKTVCKETGAYYCDIGDAVCEASDTLLANYASANNKSLNSAGLTQVLQYLRTHAI